jgi:hypothetical protein
MWWPIAVCCVASCFLLAFAVLPLSPLASTLPSPPSRSQCHPSLATFPVSLSRSCPNRPSTLSVGGNNACLNSSGLLLGPCGLTLGRLLYCHLGLAFGLGYRLGQFNDEVLHAPPFTPPLEPSLYPGLPLRPIACAVEGDRNVWA